MWGDFVGETRNSHRFDGPAALASQLIEPESYLRRAIALGMETVQNGRGGPFGAVIVRDGAIVGEGANAVIALHDPTAHAEVLAIRAASAELKNFSLAGTTIYASSEPCPMCLAAIYWARIDAIYFASDRETAARAGFDDSRFYDELALSPSERQVPVQRIEMPEGHRLFDAWCAKPDKVPY